MMLRLRAADPLHFFVSRFFEHPRIREAFSFHSLFIGGDPHRVPAVYGALVYLDLGHGFNETEADVDRYCHQVAGTVGLTMAAMLGATDPRATGAASAPGRAMQRTNILRDIDEDRGAGRVYLARDTVRAFGGSLAPGVREALLRDQIARADALYEEGLAGLELLPRRRRAIAAAAAMYREILRQIERQGYGAQAGRAVVPPRRKLAVAVRRGAFAR